MGTASLDGMRVPPDGGSVGWLTRGACGAGPGSSTRERCLLVVRFPEVLGRHPERLADPPAGGEQQLHLDVLELLVVGDELQPADAHRGPAVRLPQVTDQL